ncbi:glycosyltransferase family 2 protein [Christensenellaceae bacterium OttesenSCG-928-M15]|nr:glycosyltransferase family 2 protein [Christensenellaceae bacterium OttesenSCG-928-M15]
MSPTVSMVIACFNKEKYIEELLDSIVAQSWSNIQLILVNDGSTDRTGAMLIEYKAKLSARGIDTIIIEQENTGVALAVRNGLEKATGEFICMPDADDVLHVNYVEDMAKCLMEDEDLQWVACDSDRTRWTQCVDEYTDEPCDVCRFENLLERYILMCNYGMAWQLMIRTKYLQKVNIISCLGLLGWTTTHEAPVWMPIILGGGKGWYLPEKLYCFRDSPASLSNPGSAEKVLGYARRYRESIIKVLEFCGIKDKKYYFLAVIREFEEILIHAPELKEYACRKLSDVLISRGHIGKIIDPNTFYSEGENPYYGFLKWVWSGFIPQHALFPEGDVIAYGALGMRATLLLPVWNQTHWKPTKLWDKNGDGTTVTKPDIPSLKESDTVLVFPTNASFIFEIQDELEKSRACVLYKPEMDLLLEKLRYMSFPTWGVSENYDIGENV